MCNPLQRMDVPPNHSLVVPVLNSKTPPSWGYESTRDNRSLRLANVPLSTVKLSANSSPPTLFPSTYTTQGMESPFTDHSPSGLSTPLQGFQHRLDKNSTCWDFRNSTVATQIHPTTKTHASWMNFEQLVTPRHTTSFSTKLQLQTISKHVHNNFLQALTLRTPLLARKLHVKTTLYAKT
jgi:hypothetical protein